MKDFKVYIIIASLLLVGYLVVEYSQPKPVIWTPTFVKEDKIPFGTYILYNRITDIFPGDSIAVFREPLYNVINDHHIGNATYIIICESIDLTKYDISKLKTFIKKGNDVFISAQNFGDDLRKELKVETDMNYDLTAAHDGIHFVNKKFDLNKKYLLNKEIPDNFFSNIDTAKVTSLAMNDSLHSTYIKYSYGKGNLFLNSTPRFFTNYALVDPNRADYAAKALSYLKNNKLILWDEYYTKGREGDESIMRVLFRNPPLKWAYYISLISFILFVLYEKKRRQRIIPVIEPLRNSTVDFVTVVGQVYYEQRDNQNIAQKKIVYLLDNLREFYYLKTNKLDGEFVQKLSQKTGISHTFATELINYINYLNAVQQVTDAELIKLNQLIEQFYNQSR